MSSWVIRGSHFHFAAMLTDCHGRWRRGVAGEGWSLTFAQRGEKQEERLSAPQTGEVKSLERKQTVYQVSFPSYCQ